jgi:hypothetical protein
MVAARRYAFLVKVFDVSHDPMAADPDGIEAPSRSRRVLPLPSPVGDGEGPGRVASVKPDQFIGMKGEPAAQRVIEIVHLGGAEQTIISRLAEQAPVAGMPVRPGIGKVERVNQRRVGVGTQQQRPVLRNQPRSEGDRLLRLDDSEGYAWRSVIAHRDKRRPIRLCLNDQYPLRLPNPFEQPRTAGRRPVAGDGDTVPPNGCVVRFRDTQIDRPDHPVGASGLLEGRRRTGIELLAAASGPGRVCAADPLAVSLLRGRGMPCSMRRPALRLSPPVSVPIDSVRTASHAQRDTFQLRKTHAP